MILVTIASNGRHSNTRRNIVKIHGIGKLNWVNRWLWVEHVRAHHAFLCFYHTPLVDNNCTSKGDLGCNFQDICFSWCFSTFVRFYNWIKWKQAFVPADDSHCSEDNDSLLYNTIFPWQHEVVSQNIRLPGLQRANYLKSYGWYIRINWFKIGYALVLQEKLWQ